MPYHLATEAVPVPHCVAPLLALVPVVAHICVRPCFWERVPLVPLSVALVHTARAAVVVLA